uniref:Uncharacterized protein n=1 Tax=Eutreptiella gymnastica TaxID=73025 RepID=A0A7S4CQR6_9EUGL
MVSGSNPAHAFAAEGAHTPAQRMAPLKGRLRGSGVGVGAWNTAERCMRLRGAGDSTANEAQRATPLSNIIQKVRRGGGTCAPPPSPPQCVAQARIWRGGVRLTKGWGCPVCLREALVESEAVGRPPAAAHII